RRAERRGASPGRAAPAAGAAGTGLRCHAARRRRADRGRRADWCALLARARARAACGRAVAAHDEQARRRGPARLAARAARRRADGGSRGAARMRRPEVAVVIPAWNERENLELLLPALREVLDGLGVSSEIVVADGGSTDGSREVAARRGARVVVQTERGYGGGLLAGFAATTAPWILTMDADLSHRPVFVQELWKRRHEAEVLIASRYVPGGRADMGVLRRLLSHVLNRTYARVLALPLRDLSSGFRMYRREALEGLRPAARDFDFLEEVLIRAHAGGWRVIEVPFHYMARGSGRSH